MLVTSKRARWLSALGHVVYLVSGHLKKGVLYYAMYKVCIRLSLHQVICIPQLMHRNAQSSNASMIHEEAAHLKWPLLAKMRGNWAKIIHRCYVETADIYWCIFLNCIKRLIR